MNRADSRPDLTVPRATRKSPRVSRNQAPGLTRVAPDRFPPQPCPDGGYSNKHFFANKSPH